MYSKININASGQDFILNLTNYYKNKLSIVKNDLTSAPIKIAFPANASLFPLNLGETKSIQTTQIAGKIDIEWKNTTIAFVTNQVGLWSSI